MTHATFRFLAETLGKATQVEVVLPDGIDRSRPIPALYLLHGLSDDQTLWMRRTSIERYADGRRLAVVMPCGDRSFYSDLPDGSRYFAYVTEELPARMEALRPISRERAGRFVAGLSMGGMETMEVAFNNIDMFTYVWVLSSSMMPGQDPAAESQRLQVKKNAAKMNKQFKALVFTQGGPSDIAYKNCENTRAQLLKDGLKFDYMENAQAGHSWTTWRADLETLAPTLFK